MKRMNRRAGWGLVGGVMCGALATVALLAPPGDAQGGLAVDVHNSVWHEYGIAGSAPTMAQLEELAIALVAGDPLPSGWQKGPSMGKVYAQLSGLVDPGTGDMHANINALDESADMDYAEVFLDGVLLSTATRANGQITDRSGFALLSMSIWVPPPTETPYQIQLDWVDDEGNRRSQVHQYQ